MVHFCSRGATGEAEKDFARWEKQERERRAGLASHRHGCCRFTLSARRIPGRGRAASGGAPRVVARARPRVRTPTSRRVLGSCMCASCGELTDFHSCKSASLITKISRGRQNTVTPPGFSYLLAVLAAAFGLWSGCKDEKILQWSAGVDCGCVRACG
jgi:hypothetical protein